MFQNRLASLRKKNNLTQQELSDMLHMSRATYAQYEIGRREPDFETLKRFAEFFNVSTDYLLCRTDKPDLEFIGNTPLKEIDSLSEESLKELEKYIQLLKIKDQMDKSKKEQSSTLEKNA